MGRLHEEVQMKLADFETTLAVQQKVYDMMEFAYPVLDGFPKSQKFSFAQDLKKSMDQVLKLVITVNKKYAKLSTLEKLDVEVAALKVYVRMSYDLGYLRGETKYLTWAEYLVEIGKMVGGWIKAEREKNIDVPSGKTYICSNCNESIKATVYEYSMKKFGHSLCYKCQKIEKSKQGIG